MKLTKVLLGSSLMALSLAVMSCSSSSDSNSADKNAQQSQANSAMDASKDLSGLKTIYFDFDKYAIRPDQRQNADSVAKVLKANPTMKIQIQGNTDDRGSVEYNMALGNRRANSLKKYLITQGVASSNMTTVSFGKERPAVQGVDENARSKNRRDDIVEQK
jgi:peptidoglycan-associated lipoprotein